MLFLKLPKLMICTIFVCMTNYSKGDVIEVNGFIQYAPKDKRWSAEVNAPD